MPNNNFKQHIQQVLKSDDRLWYLDDETKATELDQILLIELAQHYDEKILALLFADQKCRAKFFVKVGENYVFKSNDFQFFLEEHKVDNSYTQYKNRIGLTDGRRFLKDTQDVVLNFPFKDGILEGGQSTEEGRNSYFEYDQKVTATNQKKGYRENQYNHKQAKRKEIFFNEILAADEIDRLTDEKALVNWKRFSKDGEEAVSEIARDRNGMIRENLILKGNNYLALHSLKKQFAGKVKLIYIDPPYNTGGDANIFTYNNNFNHSTWLTFMKNRLEVGKQLLRDDGFIAIAIDHCELFYLGTLADEIFGRENRLGIITVLHHPAGRTNDNFFATTDEYMLVYAKNSFNAELKNFDISKETEKTFNKQDHISKYKLENLMRKGETRNARRIDRPKQFYPIFVSQDLKEITLRKKENYCEVLPIEHGIEWIWSFSPKYLQENIQNNNIVAMRSGKHIKILYKRRLIHYKGKKPTTTWIDKRYNATINGTKLLENTLGKKAFSYPKSLYTVLDTLKIMTDKDDIILDFHAGSGTTGHAVLALNKEDGGNRKFILVEQLDKHIDICLERNQKVLQKENINSSFIYCELAKWNEQAKEEILACENLEELKTFFNEMVERYFLNYNLKISEFREKIIHETNFIHLPLAKQKAMFSTMLDLNQMYVCRSELGDGRFGISEEDRGMTRVFYGKGI